MISRLLVSLIIGFIFTNSTSFGLDVDEKITLRLLKVSSSKKTILINRGTEDGLEVDQHAKFFLTKGVIARGVLRKASPSRSVWSLYRLVSPQDLLEGKVMNLKIATAVKVTEDPTQAKVLSEVAPKEMAPSSTQVPVDDLTAMEQNDLETLEQNNSVELEPVSGIHYRTLEIFSLINLSTLGGDYEQGTYTGNVTSSYWDLGVGVEKYIRDQMSFFAPFSFALFLNKKQIATGNELRTVHDWFEYGAAINWHFHRRALSYERMIPYVTLGGGAGNVSLETEQDAQLGTARLINDSIDGTSTFFFGGFGTKFYLRNGFGARLVADYYRSDEKFKFNGANDLKREIGGLRIKVGLSYRW